MERFYQLKPNVVFVDAKDRYGNPLPAELAFPHIMDKSQKSAEYVKLSPGAAFITHLLAIGVDTGLIPDILRSEYGSEVADPVKEVEDVVKLLDSYLMKRQAHRPYDKTGI